MTFRRYVTADNTRPCVLCRVWRDMRQRVKGRATRTPWRYEGLPCAWNDYPSFRAFALGAGFSKATPSPDRIEANKGYVPGNVRFITVLKNHGHGKRGGFDDVRGPEPPSEDFQGSPPEEYIDGEPPF